MYLNSESEAREAKKITDGKYLKDKKVRVELDFLKIDSRIQEVHRPTSVDRFREPSRY